MFARFIPNPAGLDKFAASDEMTQEMLSRAEDGADYARGLAAEHSVSGDFAASIEASAADGVGYVVATDEAAVSIEFGTSDTEGLHVMARTVDYLQNG